MLQREGEVPMQLPKESGSYGSLVRVAVYTSRLLRRSKYEALAADLIVGLTSVRRRGRIWEDSEDAVQGGLADRDGADDDLDDVGQEARLGVASTSVAAVREAPYTQIFPQGVGYYTAAPLDQEVTRYTELKQRLETHLPEANPIRVNAVPRIEMGIIEFTAATNTLTAAERDQVIARTELVHAIRSLRRQLEKTYGLLVADIGKIKAERYFPKVKSSKKDADDEG